MLSIGIFYHAPPTRSLFAHRLSICKKARKSGEPKPTAHQSLFLEYPKQVRKTLLLDDKP